MSDLDEELAQLEDEVNEEFKKETEEEEKRRIEVKKKAEKAKELDPYSKVAEEKFHNIEKMFSLEVLSKEKEICDSIIQYKENNFLNEEFWLKKKNFIDIKIQFVSNLVQNSKFNCDLYKTMLNEQIKSEEKNLKSLEKNIRLTEIQRKMVIDRINNRKKIVENELKENLDIKYKVINDLGTEGIPSNDLYPIIIENKYHKMNVLTCLGVLEKESVICDEIIEYKKGLLLDYALWEKKKGDIEEKIKSISKTVEDGDMDLEGYKSMIKIEKEWEEKYLGFVGKEANLTQEQKEIIKKRINERKDAIDEELNKNVEDDDEEDQKE